MLLINCKVEFKWTESCVLSATGADNNDANSKNIIFTIKETKLYVPVVTLSAKDNQKPSKLKIQQIKIDIFSNQILLKPIDYLFYFIHMKMTILKDLKLRNITNQKT